MTCPRCGYEWKSGERVCPACGRRRGLRPAVWIAVFAAVLLLLTAAGGGIWWLSRRPGTEPETDFPTDPVEVSATTQSNTVRVTIPEGYTVERIAALLEEREVCTAAAFRDAVQNGDFAEFAFVSAIPMTDESGASNGRVYRLEGYLFPDTYEFYRNGGGESAVRRFLQNFQRKLADWQDALDQSGMTLDEAVTFASIVQGEVGHAADMKRVARVLQNRLDSPDYPRLQCDVTTKYLRELATAGVDASREAYDTYVCRGLPVGAINNPGLAALRAAVSPSDEEICAGCYFFVIDSANDTVYYSRTYAEHLAFCREHKLGGYAE